MAKVEENKRKRQETVDKKASQSKKPKTNNTNSNRNTTVARFLEDNSFMELEVVEQQERVFPTPSEEEDNSEEGKIIDENEKLETVSPSNAEATEPKNKSTESAVRSWSASPRRSSAA